MRGHVATNQKHALEEMGPSRGVAGRWKGQCIVFAMCKVLVMPALSSKTKAGKRALQIVPEGVEQIIPVLRDFGLGD